MVSGKRPILKEEFEDTKSEPVNQRRTDNTMTKKKTKEHICQLITPYQTQIIN
jgi:DeoR/GlpR family transcriptional regulator of sugar metabolism